MDIYSVGLWAAVAALLCYGFGDFLAAVGVRKVSVTQAMFIQKSFSLCLMLLLVLFVSNYSFSATGLMWGFAGGFVSYMGTFFCYTALKRVPSSIVFPIVNTCFLWSMILGILFLGEDVTLLGVLGSLLIFVGTGLASLHGSIRMDREQSLGIVYALIALFCLGDSFYVWTFFRRFFGPVFGGIL
ncbi:MAG: EamA family transporter [Alphaproteobacteria bacterium]|nr:EamA family transporter [Alphaproteobacteria bacterium]MDD9920622.1 EamA family transporter [Alphaproteobacteria bacterium]